MNEHDSPIRSILVLGGGSAGFLAAMTLKRKLPDMPVTLLRSPQLGIIGVGEGTHTYVPEHLHGFLRIPVGEFLEQAKPLWKLGTRFKWGKRDLFYYPFTPLVTREVEGLPRSAGFYADDELTCADHITALMHAGKAFERDAFGAPVLHRSMAYHLENEHLVSYLERVALRWGVEVVDDTIDHVVHGPAGVAQLIGEQGRTYDADLFVDCSGFRSRLLGEELAEPYESFRSSLFCDRAVAGGWDRTSEPILPFTTSTTMSSGWMWQIEHEHRIHRGYVYSGDFQSDEDAEREFRAACPLVTDTRLVKFRSGMYRRSWVRNVVAIGNAAGFVEPLEATALFVICSASQALATCLNTSQLRPEEAMRRRYNDYNDRIWRSIRRFLAVHYRFNGRLETPFWQACRADVDLADGTEIVEYFQEYGPDGLWSQTFVEPVDPFRLEGYFMLLQGLCVPWRRRYDPPAAERQRWQQLKHSWKLGAGVGLTMAESLAVVRLPQWRWNDQFYQ